MSDRKLREPNHAMKQLLTGLSQQQARMQNRQRWQGAIQRTTTEGAAAATTNNSEVTVASVDLEPGAWAVFGRAGVQISSTNGTPTFTGTEAFTVRMNVLRRDTSTILEELDIDFWCPATEDYPWTGGFYAASVTLFGSMTYDEQTTVVVVASADDGDAADHIIPWRAGKIMALPF